MGHISQAWTNLAPPSVNCVADCPMESYRASGDSDCRTFSRAIVLVLKFQRSFSPSLP